MPDLDRVDAPLDEGPGALRRGDVAGHELDVGVALADLLDGVEHAPGVAVRGVDADDVGLSLHQGLHPFVGVLGHAHRRAHPQPAQLVLAGVGELDHLRDVLDGDHAPQLEVVVHHQELLDLVDLELLDGLVEGGAHGHGHQVLGGHERRDGLAEVGLEAGVAVGDDAGQPPVGMDDRDAGDAVLLHEGLGVAVGGGERQRDGVHDHPRLTPLDLAHHLGLPVDRLVLVDDGHAALAGQSDGESGLGDGVHGRGQQRDVEGDLAGQAGSGRRSLSEGSLDSAGIKRMSSKLRPSPTIFRSQSITPTSFFR